MSEVALASILNQTISFAIPLLLVALGAMYSERSGIINIAMDGIMIIGALCGCLVLRAMNTAGWGETVGKSQMGLLIAILVAGASGILFSLLLAFAAINLKADQTIGGTALNIFAPAFCVVVAWAVQGQGLTGISIPKWTALNYKNFNIPGSVKADFWPALFKKFYITVPIAVILFIAAWFVLYHTRFGLRLRACGEHPQAADSVGINVYKMRYSGVMISGFLGGVGGMAYVLAAGSSFEGDVGGYGFLAIAVMIFGNWKPFRILFSAFFFALFRILGTSFTLLPFLPKFSSLGRPSNVYNLLPYIVTIIVLVFTSKSSHAPKAEGIPYDKGQR